jgi:type III pantothenate kinase
LGSDRWAALIAAWHLLGQACLVVNCGTATTVDALTNQGEFMGGLILPSVAMMQRSLVEGTAQLKTGLGEYAAFPLNTADAILSGAIQASCGAIQRQHDLLKNDAAPILLSGGASAMLLPHLNNLPIRESANLVLQGLGLIAYEANA